VTLSSLHRTSPAPPVRIVHLGLGAFSRSHTAWYTHASPNGEEWGIAAYTGRSRDLSDRLSAQEGLFTLIQRDDKGDRAEVVASVARAHPGDDIDALVQDLAAAETSIVTLTITEVGYRLGFDDQPDDADPMVAHDREELRSVATGRLTLSKARPVTAPGRLLLGLEARRRAGGGPIAVLSCDNIPDNGGRLRRGLIAWVEGPAPDLCQWINANVSFVSSSVDRITPRISAPEEGILRARYGDQAPVVTEPFRDWVISGSFPAGRPAWEGAGARFVEDIEPWEARKLWLLNGAHTLLACLGLLRGHETVADAIADPVCRSAVDALWDDAEVALPSGIDVGAYREALLERFANPRIAHLLGQIVQDTDTKIQLRVTPVAEILRARADEARGCGLALAAWITARANGLIPGSNAAQMSPDHVKTLVHQASAVLSADEAFLAQVNRFVESFAGVTNGRR